MKILNKAHDNFYCLKGKKIVELIEGNFDSYNHCYQCQIRLDNNKIINADWWEDNNHLTVQVCT